LQDARRQQLTEKEAALAAKEQELKKLSSKLDAQLKTVEKNKKQLNITQNAKKKVLDEKRKKIITLFKKMRPEQAGQMIDKLEEQLAISVLDQMDTKSVIKLVPFLNQPRVLKWINENLKGV
jgi:flagellar motility protein MotE (MotC chaperone)